MISLFYFTIYNFDNFWQILNTLYYYNQYKYETIGKYKSYKF